MAPSEQAAAQSPTPTAANASNVEQTHVAQMANLEPRTGTNIEIRRPAPIVSRGASQIRLTGRGVVTTTKPSTLTQNVGIDREKASTYNRQMASGSNSSLTQRDEMRLPQESRQIAATNKQQHVSSQSQTRRQFHWVMQDREKRNVNSKYARLAVATVREPKTYAEAMSSDDREHWQRAVDAELAALDKNQTWKVVEKDASMREITVKWVFKIKLNADGEVKRYKARLVARGFSQVEGVDYGEVYAPVVHTDSLRLLFAICAQYNLVFEQFDIATAFLNGELEEVIHIQPPEGLNVPENKTLRLLKSLYGLKQAPRCFNKKFKQVLSQLNMKQISSDPCVFTGCDKDLIILALYVDDGIVFAKNTETIDRLINGIKRKFELKTVKTNYFLGLEIIQDREKSRIFLHQRAYAKSVLAKFGFSDSKSVATPLEVGHSLNKPEILCKDSYDCPYQELLGSLNYLATRTRPDLAFVLSVCSKFMDKPREAHWQALKRTMRYLQGTIDYGLLYEPIEQPYIKVFSDADYGGDHENRRSTSGMACFINSGLISYKAQQQQIVTLSTTEAEYIACTLGVCWNKR